MLEWKWKIVTYWHVQRLVIKIKLDDNKFYDMSGTLNGEVLFDKIMDDFYIHYQVRIMFTITPKYKKYTKLDVAYRKIVSYRYPIGPEWECLTNFAP